MSAPLIYETARVPITEQAPSGQPLTGQTVRSDNRVSMDPDTFDWAYVEGPATMGTAKQTVLNWFAKTLLNLLVLRLPTLGLLPLLVVVRSSLNQKMVPI